MSTLFESSDGTKFILGPDPVVFLGSGDSYFVFVSRYAEPVEIPKSVVTSALAADAAGAPAPASVDDLTTYAEHNGDTPHADPAMRCGCAACKRVDGRT